MNEQQIWESVLERLHTSIGPAVFATWFQGATALSLQDDMLVVGVTTTFAKAHLEARYSSPICSLLKDITGVPLNIRFVVAHEMYSLDDTFLVQRDSDLQETGTVPFLVVITKENSSYKASVPDVPGCLAVGKTQEEAVQGVREALQAYLGMMRKDCISLPEPHTTAQYIRLPLFFNQEQGGTQTWKDSTSTLSSVSHCSFCDKPQDQITNLTAGPGGVHICNKCVDLCRTMIEQGTVDFQQLKQALASYKPEAFQ